MLAEKDRLLAEKDRLMEEREDQLRRVIHIFDDSDRRSQNETDRLTRDGSINGARSCTYRRNGT